MNDPTFVIFGFRRQSCPPEGRFEYRVWPRPQHPAVSLLHCHFPLTDAERRIDIYLMSAVSDLVLVKLRDGARLEIKRRGKDVGSVQYWEMPVSTGFPLTSGDRELLAEALGLPGKLPVESGLSPAHLLAALDMLRPRVFPRTVRKSRLVFQAGLCRAEVCRVATGGWTGLTVALEATEIPSIASAIDALHLGGLPNRSYGEALFRLFASQPDWRGLPAAVQDTQGKTA